MEDKESEITLVAVAVGSTSQSIDIMPHQEMDSSTIVLPDNLPVHDGHLYYAHIKVLSTNNCVMK